MYAAGYLAWPLFDTVVHHSAAVYNSDGVRFDDGRCKRIRDLQLEMGSG